MSPSPTTTTLTLSLLSSFCLLLLLPLCCHSITSTLSSLEEETTPYDVLIEYNLPVGLLPEGATGYDLDRETGKFTVYLPRTCYVKVGSYKLRFKPTIIGWIYDGRLTGIDGVSVYVWPIWKSISQVVRNGDELTFSIWPVHESFPVHLFNHSPPCGDCPCDCDDDFGPIGNNYQHHQLIKMLKDANGTTLLDLLV